MCNVGILEYSIYIQGVSTQHRKYWLKPKNRNFKVSKFNLGCITTIWQEIWVFATNSDFLIPVFLGPIVVDHKYFWNLKGLWPIQI